MGEKTAKKAGKSGRESRFLPEKKVKIRPKNCFSGTFAVSRAKKKHYQGPVHPDGPWGQSIPRSQPCIHKAHPSTGPLGPIHAQGLSVPKVHPSLGPIFCPESIHAKGPSIPKGNEDPFCAQGSCMKSAHTFSGNIYPEGPGSYPCPMCIHAVHAYGSSLPRAHPS